MLRRKNKQTGSFVIPDPNFGKTMGKEIEICSDPEEELGTQTTLDTLASDFTSSRRSKKARLIQSVKGMLSGKVKES